jgi:ATP-dependent RNA helicase RhlE
MAFDELELSPELLRAVEEIGWTEPTPIQRESVPLILEGKDVLGCAQTGSGKTAAYVLPLLNRMLAHRDRAGLRMLVLVPTRELATQVEQTVLDCGRHTPFKVSVVIGGVGYEGQRRAVAGGAQVMVATPGRLLDHLQQGTFQLTRIEHLILDEADRMLDMGFLPDIRAILARVPSERQTLLFSATLLPEVEKIASFALKDPVRINISRPTSVAEGISQVLYPITQNQKTQLLLTLLRNTEMRSVLIFTRTKHGADRLANKLEKERFKVEVLHSNRTQGQRTVAMENFRQGRVQILVATDIAARGIDVREISHVINHDVPQHPEDYVHRVGRTARAYGVGDAITLMDPLEQTYVSDIERFIGVVFPRAMVPNFPYEITPKLDGPKPKSGWEKVWGNRRAPRRRLR